MSTLTVAWRTRGPLPALARHEVRRLLRNPVFVLVVVLGCYSVGTLTSRAIVQADELPAYPAGFLGGIGMILTCWLTQSLNRAAEVLDVTPTAMRVRTTALCVTAVLPLLVAVSTLVVVRLWSVPQGPWTYGVYNSGDRLAIQLSQIVIPALGGPLLGIMLGRWCRQVWVGPAAFLMIFGWIELTEGLATTHQNSLVVAAMRLFAPFAFFTSFDNASQGVESWRGSPVAFLSWQLCLCALAVVAALFKSADPLLRRRLTDALLVILALLAATYYLAVTGGLQHAVIVYPESPPQPL